MGISLGTVDTDPDTRVVDLVLRIVGIVGRGARSGDLERRRDALERVRRVLLREPEETESTGATKFRAEEAALPEGGTSSSLARTQVFR